MNTAEVRMECYRLAGTAKGLFSTLQGPRDEIAEKMANFCSSAGEAKASLYLAAVKLAAEEANRRADASDIINRATEILKFVYPPEPVVPEKQHTQRGKQKYSR